MNGRVVDGILLLVAVEAAALVLLHRVTGRGVAPTPLLTNLLAGACLLMALRFGVTGATPAVLLCLALAGLAHLADLRARWGRS